MHYIKLKMKEETQWFSMNNIFFYRRGTDMKQELKNRFDSLNDENVVRYEVERLHKDLMYKLINEKAHVAAKMLSQGKYKIEIILSGFKFEGIFEVSESEQQVMDNVLGAIREFIIA